MALRAASEIRWWKMEIGRRLRGKRITESERQGNEDGEPQRASPPKQRDAAEQQRKLRRQRASANSNCAPEQRCDGFPQGKMIPAFRPNRNSAALCFLPSHCLLLWDVEGKKFDQSLVCFVCLRKKLLVCESRDSISLDEMYEK
ncbi:hypothetical protein NPIL_486061 [Nephila pilipes]|uniref:Uncharacterized protein n=1 Tax=Nephila pilipes TaxID=299642 RepID=A0A8X6MM35_NEPPI|nr:hypothetical protein NPIL_486061 [Nephila pilipes]